MSHDAYVGNAGDEVQTRSAGRRETRDIQSRADLLRWQLSTQEGRRFVWEDLKRHRLFQRIPSLHEASIYEFVGQYNMAVDLWMDIKQHCPEALMQMQQEAYARERRQSHDTHAVHTARASEPG